MTRLFAFSELPNGSGQHTLHGPSTMGSMQECVFGEFQPFGPDGYSVGFSSERDVSRAVMSDIARHPRANPSVPHILRLRSETKMGWIAARRMVADVKNGQSLADPTYCQFIGDAVASSVAPSPSHDPVAVIGSGSSPQPAVIRIAPSDVAPEDLGFINLCVLRNDVVTRKKVANQRSITASTATAFGRHNAAIVTQQQR